MYLYLVGIAWVYVVLLMSMTEQSVVAGVMTFLLYCVVPLSIILYVMATPQRRRKRQEKESRQPMTAPNDAPTQESDKAVGAESPQPPPAT